MILTKILLLQMNLLHSIVSLGKKQFILKLYINIIIILIMNKI
jgi:hypothetical protein